MNRKVYKWCTVPQCTNTSIKTPGKLFVYVPNNKTMRNKWLKLARRDPTAVSLNSSIYFCEDHFDLPNDMVNYIEYHVMGLVSQVRMKPGCIPTKFECQSDRRKQTEQPCTAKKQRKVLLEECEKEHLESGLTSSGISDTIHKTVLKMSEVVVKQEPELDPLDTTQQDVCPEYSEIEQLIKDELDVGPTVLQETRWPTSSDETSEKSYGYEFPCESCNNSLDSKDEEQIRIEDQPIMIIDANEQLPPPKSLLETTGLATLDDSAANILQPGPSSSTGESTQTGRKRSHWTRGMPFVERFKTDEELPENLRQRTPVCVKRKIAKRKDEIQMCRVSDGAGGESKYIGRGGLRLVERFRTDEDLPENLRQRITVRGKRKITEKENEKKMYGDFEWKPIGNWRGVKEHFACKNPGPVSNFDNAYDAFRAYWDDSILSRIATETNSYTRVYQNEKFQRKWFDTNLDEILILFAFWIMLGIIRMPTIKSCFDTRAILQTEVFRRLFSESRYWCVSESFLLAHCSRDPSNPDNPMRDVLNHLNAKFKQLYVPRQDICIREFFTLGKRSLGFRQVAQMKTARYGMTTYLACECDTGYVWSFLVNVGRRTPEATFSRSVSTVTTLIRPLLDSGHTLYMCNWLSCPALARYLKRRHTDCVGPLNPNRKLVPPVIQMPLARGQFAARHCGDVMVAAVKDDGRLSFVSTCHGAAVVERGNRYVLQVHDDYYRRVRPVDRSTNTLVPYLDQPKKLNKWTIVLLKRLLNITIKNARVLVERSGCTTMNDMAFRLSLVDSIIDRHLSNVPKTNPTKPPQIPERLTGRHFIRRRPITDEMRMKVKHRTNLGRRRCVWCTYMGRARKTLYECPDCGVPLCLDFCFEEYHTVPV